MADIYMSSLTQTWMTYFLLWNIKEGILKTVGTKAVLVTSDIHCMNEKKKKKTQMFLKLSSFMFHYC